MTPEMIGPDQKIESFLRTIIGCPFQFIEHVMLSRINIKDTRQVSRSADNSQDYIAGITQTILLGAYVPPVILSAYHKGSYLAVDGIHRICAAQAAKRETISAYVVDADEEMLELIASTVNTYLNGQGLTEEERRVHFLMIARKQSPDLVNVNMRDRLLKRSMLLLAIATSTAFRWVEVEVLRNRVERLGLKLPPPLDGRHATGQRKDAWILALSKFTDEELVKYWANLIIAPATAIRRATSALDKCTSSQQRVAQVDNLMTRLNPTVRVISQSQDDRDRRSANQIRSHGAGLLKIADEFHRLAAKYDDVRATLEAVYLAISGIGVDQAHGREEDAVQIAR